MFKALVTGVLLLSSVAVSTLPAAAEVGPNGGYPAYVCTNDVGGRLTVRRGPGQGNRQITQIRSGQEVRVLNSRSMGDGFTWHLVATQSRRGRIQGWVRADYVCNYGN